MDFETIIWYYRGEGNRNLVIALPHLHKILRIPKRNTKTEFSSSVRYQKNFYQIIAPYINIYAKEPEIILLKDSDIDVIESKIISDRPINRCHKHLQSGEALMMPDYALVPQPMALHPTFCVELKLKQGWIPESDRINRCVFCIHQYHKLKTKQINTMTHYCPLNIFSGNQNRMISALKALMEIPQNNFQVFKNGAREFQDGNSQDCLLKIIKELFSNEIVHNELLKHKFAELIIQALHNNFSKTNVIDFVNSEELHYYTQTVLQEKPLCCPIDELTLPEHSVLKILYDLQKLNKMGTKQIYSIYKNFCKQHSSCENWNIINLSSLPPNDDIQVLYNYLLFSTFRDCSLMITFQQLNKNNNNIEFLTNVAITDLDLKPLSCIEKHFRQRNCGIESYSKK